MSDLTVAGQDLVVRVLDERLEAINYAMEAVEKTRKHQDEQLKLTFVLSDLKSKLARRDAELRSDVWGNEKYKNEGQRNAALTLLLADDTIVSSLSVELALTEAKIAKLRDSIEEQRATLSVYRDSLRALAGLAGVS